MEQRAPAEYILEVFADQTLVKDIVKGWAHAMHALHKSVLIKLRRRPSHDIFPSLLSLNTTLSARSPTPRYHTTIHCRTS